VNEDLSLQPFGGDWQAVLQLTDAVVPNDPDGNREWLANRQSFDEASRTRRQHEVRTVPTGEMLAYGAIEETESRVYRVFIVPARDDCWQTAGALVYERLASDLLDLGATKAWLREYDTDAASIAFFATRGFVRDFHTVAYSGPADAAVEQGWALGFHASRRGDELYVNVPDHLEQGFLGDERSRGFVRRYGTVRLVKTLV
jgi:hypothetical protein